MSVRLVVVGVWVGVGDEGGGVQVIHTVTGQGRALLRDVIEASRSLCEGRIHPWVGRTVDGGDARVGDAAFICWHRLGPG